MPTVIGVIIFCCALYCFFLMEDALPALLILSSVFQAASALNIAERGIQPYYVVALFVMLRALLNWFVGPPQRKRMPQAVWLLLFGIIAVASAFILPGMFAGIPVYDPKIGIDDGFFIRPPLSFGLNNIAQAAFLACHIATAYAVLSIGFSSNKQARRAYVIAFYVVVVIIVAQSACQFMGISFPNSLILNNPGYSLWDLDAESGGTRNPGTFSEPSFAGGFLAMYFAGFLAEYLAGTKRSFNVIVALVATALVASGGSLLTLFVVTLGLLLRHIPFRPPWHIDLARSRRFVWVALLLAVPVAFAVATSSGFGEALVANSVSKAGSSSFINRTASDLYALQLFVQTHGLGVGLGSSRASSLLTTLLSNVGIAGVLAFTVYCVKLFGNLPKPYAWLRWAALALLLNMCINIPDVTMPTLWIPILLAIQFTGDEASGRQVEAAGGG